MYYNPGMDGYDFEKLSREIIVKQVGMMEEKQAEAAAQMAEKILVAALKSTHQRQEPALTVKATCRGVLGGMMFIHQELPIAAVLILKELGHVSHETHFSAEELMTWAMQGMAEIAAVAGAPTAHAMESAIEEALMGAGPVFAELYKKACAS